MGVSPTLGLLAFGILAATFLFRVESQVFKQEDLAVLAVRDGLFNFRSNTVVEECNRLREELFQLLGLVYAHDETHEWKVCISVKLC